MPSSILLKEKAPAETQAGDCITKELLCGKKGPGFWGKLRRSQQCDLAAMVGNSFLGCTDRSRDNICRQVIVLFLWHLLEHM